MASHHRSTSVAGTGPAREKTYFEQQREELIGEIAMVRSALVDLTKRCCERVRPER
jgi:hypothetical protein